MVDTYDAIVSDRPYRMGAEPECAIEEIKKFKGSQFDPVLVNILVEVWQEGLIDQLGIYQEIEAELDPISESESVQSTR